MFAVINLSVFFKDWFELRTPWNWTCSLIIVCIRHLHCLFGLLSRNRVAVKTSKTCEIHHMLHEIYPLMPFYFLMMISVVTVSYWSVFYEHISAFTTFIHYNQFRTYRRLISSVRPFLSTWLFRSSKHFTVLLTAEPLLVSEVAATTTFPVSILNSFNVHKSRRFVQFRQERTVYLVTCCRTNGKVLFCSLSFLCAKGKSRWLVSLRMIKNCNDRRW